MRENRFFVRSTDLRGHLAARIGEAPAILSYSSVIERVATLAGPEAASLFAEPVLPRGVSDAGTAISWYSTHEGVVLELDTIDEVARRPIAERLTQRLAALAPALADRDIGATLSTWLNVTSPRDVLAVGGEPVLVNWGFLPTDHIPPLDQRRQEFARRLGRYAPQLPLPPAQVDAAQMVTPAEAAAVAGAVSAGVAAPPPRRQAHVTDGGGPPSPPAGGSNDGSAPGGEGRRRPWLAPLVATAVAALALLLLLVPGVLVYPSSGNSTTSADFEADRLRASTTLWNSSSKPCRMPLTTASAVRPTSAYRCRATTAANNRLTRKCRCCRKRPSAFPFRRMRAPPMTPAWRMSPI